MKGRYCLWRSRASLVANGIEPWDGDSCPSFSNRTRAKEPELHSFDCQHIRLTAKLRSFEFLSKLTLAWFVRQVDPVFDHRDLTTIGREFYLIHKRCHQDQSATNPIFK